MQTFLPFEDFTTSAIVLDRERLGKQRAETLQILKALHDGGAWSNHPAALMWRGHERVLIEYGLVICEEWLRRGYKDNTYAKIAAYIPNFEICEIPGHDSCPEWLGDPDFHRAHRSNLLRKKPDWYGPLFEDDLDDDLPYIWPVGD